MEGKREVFTPAYEQLGKIFPETRILEPAANAKTVYVFCKKGNLAPRCIPEICLDASCDECPPGVFKT